MNDNQLQVLKDLLIGRMERFDNSRNIQWKLNASLWAGIVIVTGYTYGKIHVPLLALVIIAIIVCFIHYQTVKSIQSSLDWDKKLMVIYHDLINDSMPEETKKQLVDYMGVKNFKGKSKQWKSIQFVVTICLSLASVLLLFDWSTICAC